MERYNALQHSANARQYLWTKYGIDPRRYDNEVGLELVIHSVVVGEVLRREVLHKDLDDGLTLMVMMRHQMNVIPRWQSRFRARLGSLYAAFCKNPHFRGPE